MENILRLYECKNAHTKVNVRFAFDADKVYLTDMLENNTSSVDMSDSAFVLDFKPFEIKTVRIKNKKNGENHRRLFYIKKLQQTLKEYIFYEYFKRKNAGDL